VIQAIQTLNQDPWRYCRYHGI